MYVLNNIYKLSHFCQYDASMCASHAQIKVSLFEDPKITYT